MHSDVLLWNLEPEGSIIELEAVMVTLDFPAVLIIVGLLAGLAWAVYNWTHREHTPH